MRLSTYRDFLKSVKRIRLLYEATMNSYNNLYEDGREALRNTDERNSKIEFKLGGTTVSRPLNVVTFHARDVYPDLLRQTLLISLVASYEAFLIDAVEEISSRSAVPFMTDQKIELSQRHLITIESKEGIFRYIVDRTTRKLSNGGLGEIRSFYQTRLGTDIVENANDFALLSEINDRRNLYVHRSGYVDGQYVKKHSTSGAVDGKKIPVTEAYLIASISTIEKSGSYVRKKLEGAYPTAPVRRYTKGSLALPSEIDNLQFLSFKPITESGRRGFEDLSLTLGNGRILKDITVWLSNDGETIRLLLGGSGREIKSLRLALLSSRKNGDIRSIQSMKLKR